MLKLAIAPGEEVLEAIGRQLADQGITDGAIVSLIGMVLECEVSTMKKDDASNDIGIQYSEALELSGSGEIKNGKVHIHVVLGAEGNRAISGHLRWARAGNASTNVYILPLYHAENKMDHLG